MRRIFGILAALCLCMSVARLAWSDTVYNNAADFSPTSNPSGVWTYGYLAAGTSPDPSTFTAYTSNGSAGGLEYWNISGGGLNPPEIFYNPSSSAVNFSTITIQAHQAAFHPGQDDQYSDYRFTAPQAGSYSLAAAFSGIDVGSNQSGATNGTTTDVHVLDNGVSLFGGLINGYGDTTTFSMTLVLKAGDLVNFAVGYGSNNNYFDDSTGINATLTFNGASVPEPGSLILLGTGCLGLLGCAGSRLARSRTPADRAGGASMNRAG